MIGREIAYRFRFPLAARRPAIAQWAQPCRLTEPPTARGLKIGEPYAESVKVFGNVGTHGPAADEDGARMMRLTIEALPLPTEALFSLEHCVEKVGGSFYVT